MAEAKNEWEEVPVSSNDGWEEVSLDASQKKISE